MMISQEDWMLRFRLRIPYKIEEESGEKLNKHTRTACCNKIEEESLQDRGRKRLKKLIHTIEQHTLHAWH